MNTEPIIFSTSPKLTKLAELIYGRLRETWIDANRKQERGEEVLQVQLNGRMILKLDDWKIFLSKFESNLTDYYVERALALAAEAFNLYSENYSRYGWYPYEKETEGMFLEPSWMFLVNRPQRIGNLQWRDNTKSGHIKSVDKLYRKDSERFEELKDLIGPLTINTINWSDIEL